MLRARLLMSVCMLAGMSVAHEAAAQRLGVDMKAIDRVIQEWDYANNARSVESFERVYADTLLFYTEVVTQSRAIILKQRMFRQKPSFRQKISTGIECVPFTSGLTKCDFTKEVRERESWKAYPSYLLVSYENNRYQIVGESDYATDRVLRYSLEIGEPIKFEKSRDVTDSAYESLSVAASSDTFRAEMDTAIETLDSLLKPVDPLTMFPQLSSMGLVIVPRGYVFLLVGFLAAGGLMIFIADSVRTRRRHREDIVSHKRSRKKRLFKDHEVQSVFEHFVITLFDPLYFRHRKRKLQPVLTDNTTGDDRDSDLEFEFHYKETQAKFRVMCQYYKEAPGEIRLFSSGGYQLFREAVAASVIPHYLVLGFGGTPDDPRELFLVPADEIKREWIHKESLQSYSKSGMFFYNRVAGRLQ